MKNIFNILVLLLATILLSACAEQFAELNLNVGGGEPDVLIKRFDGENNDVELRLDPVYVWDNINVESEKVKVDGRELYVRKRPSGGIFERAWVRLGVFWHSKTDYVFIPIVVLGSPVEIRGLLINSGQSRASLKKADNIKFKPGSKMFDSDNKKSSAVFKMSLKVFKTITSAKKTQVVIQTNRGNLAVGLDVVTGDSTDDLRTNAKNLIVQFHDMIQDIKKGV